MYYQLKSFGMMKTEIWEAPAKYRILKKVLALIRYMTEDNSIGNSFGNSTVSEGRDF
jgi:hypothetical protein